MPDYAKLRSVCNETQSLSLEFVDKYLIYYAAEKDGLSQEADLSFKKYNQVLKKLPPQVSGFFKSQYIAHKIFKNGGLVNKYLKSNAFKKQPKAFFDLLKLYQTHPWRYSFAKIIERPAEDFFEMWDVFRDENYLLFSPGMTTTLEEKTPNLWFSLTSNNGSCHQTFGVIAGLNSFLIDDIYFYATEVNPKVETSEDIVQEVEQNPVPYMMLLNGSTIPPIVNKGEIVVNNYSEEDSELPDLKKAKKDFDILEKDHLIQLLPKKMDSGMIVKAFYDRDTKIIIRHADSDRAFLELTNLLNKSGFSLNEEPDIRLTPGMQIAIKDILKRTVNLIGPYETVFEKKVSDSAQKTLANMNLAIHELLPKLNEGKKFDLHKISTKYKIPVETLEDLVSHLKKITGKLKK